MKSTFFKHLITLFILILTVGCSVENEEIIEQAAIEETQVIGSLPLVEDGYLTPIQIIYEPNLTHAEVNGIRATFTNDGFINITSITTCTNTNYIEIWHANIQYCDTCKPFRDPKGEIESNGGVNKAYLHVDSCIQVVE